MTVADRWILLLQVGSTLYMVGLIWFVQLVHYPLFGRVGSEGFPAYADAHQFWTTLAVGPPMLVEMATALLLLRRTYPGWECLLPGLGLALLVVVWLSTFFLQVPQHERLSQGFDPAAHTFLVVSNWLRTAAWSLRGVLVLYLVSLEMR